MEMTDSGKKILLIGTGGTISCLETENGLTPALSAQKLLSMINAEADVEVEQMFELDSTDMTPRCWEKIARYIHSRYDAFDGFVITHGTDTMAYGAAALSCLIQNADKPIIFTGSMLTLKAENSDVLKNLSDALFCASNKDFFGVRLVFKDMVYDGRSVSKCSSTRLNAFQDQNGEFLPDLTISASGPRFYERLSDNVFYVKLIPGQKLYVPENTKALILESYGAGGIPAYLMETVKELASAGVYIIIGTQCAFGGTNLAKYKVGRSALNAFPIIETGMYTAEYSIARAQWAVEYSNNFTDFKSLFSCPC